MAGAHGGGGGLVFFLAAVVVLAAAASAEPPAAVVVVGSAKCGDCSRKNMKAAQAFKGLHVAIKCRNSAGEYESKAAGELDARTGAFSVPVTSAAAAGDCFAQLHTAANAPCPGQEPSRIVPLSDGTFGLVAGERTTTTTSAAPECASATLCGPIKKHLLDHFHKKPLPPSPETKPKPQPDYHPTPTPTPDYHPVPPTPTYGHPSTPVQPTPTYGHPSTPDYHPVPPTPTYGHPSTAPSATLCGPIKKHLLDHFHKKPAVPSKPEPQPEYHPSTPTYGHPSTPIYHPPAKH